MSFPYSIHLMDCDICSPLGVTLSLSWWLSCKESAIQEQQKTWVQSLSQEDLLEIFPVGCMATHSNIFAWEIPWTEEPGRLQFIGLQRVRRSLAIEKHKLDKMENKSTEQHKLDKIENKNSGKKKKRLSIIVCLLNCLKILLWCYHCLKLFIYLICLFMS